MKPETIRKLERIVDAVIWFSLGTLLGLFVGGGKP